ncbi:MAG: hypothetical protein IKD29_02440 [Lentisphaeria bacterium]|nr:hypothetical protein [Lentisphaeria bacterium]
MSAGDTEDQEPRIKLTFSSAPEFTVKGINKLMIRFANTAGNIYGELDAPFGVENARLFK